jgi:two-component sensor histidine kinase
MHTKLEEDLSNRLANVRSHVQYLYQNRQIDECSFYYFKKLLNGNLRPYHDYDPDKKLETIESDNGAIRRKDGTIIGYQG